MSENDDEVIVGEMKIQFSASGSDAKEEIRELQEMIGTEVRDLDDARGVIESFAMSDFDRRLGWDGDSE